MDGSSILCLTYKRLLHVKGRSFTNKGKNFANLRPRYWKCSDQRRSFFPQEFIQAVRESLKGWVPNELTSRFRIVARKYHQVHRVFTRELMSCSPGDGAAQ